MKQLLWSFVFVFVSLLCISLFVTCMLPVYDMYCVPGLRTGICLYAYIYIDSTIVLRTTNYKLKTFLSRVAHRSRAC